MGASTAILHVARQESEEEEIDFYYHTLTAKKLKIMHILTFKMYFIL